MQLLDRAPEAALFETASIETTARERAVASVIDAPLPRGTSVYITALPDNVPEDVVTAATRLRRAGFNPVPHLGARYVESERALEILLGRLADEAGVVQALVIGGDLDRPRGPYDSALALLRSPVFAALGPGRIGLAAYPEGHKRIPTPALEAALAAKLALARSLGLDAYVVTQFCFDAPPLAAWLTGFAARFAGTPVHLGLAGPASLSTLVKYGVSCGVGASLRALHRNAGLGRLLTQASPEPILHALLADPATRGRIARLHLFTFGGIERTARWLDGLRSAACSI